MSAPYDPRICCRECWSIEEKRRLDEEWEDWVRNHRVDVRPVAPQDPVWIDSEGYIYCREHIPPGFFDLKRCHEDQPCEACGARPAPIKLPPNFPDFGITLVEEMIQTPSGRIFCSFAHVPAEELKERHVLRVGPCETCRREVHTGYGQAKDAKPPRLFCSSRCHIRFYDLRKQARRARDKRRPCAVCGKVFEPRQSNAITCSSACRQKAYRQRRLAAS